MSLMSTKFVVNGRPVDVLENFADDDEHGYVYRFIQGDEHVHWIRTGDPRCSTASEYETWMGG